MLVSRLTVSAESIVLLKEPRNFFSCQRFKENFIDLLKLTPIEDTTNLRITISSRSIERWKGVGQLWK